MVFGTRSATIAPGSGRQQTRWGKSCAVDILMLGSPWIDSNTYIYLDKTHGPPILKVYYYNFSQIT